MCDIAALKFACIMAIEAGALKPIAALLSDIFDIRKEVLVFAVVQPADL